MVFDNRHIEEEELKEKLIELGEVIEDVIDEFAQKSANLIKAFLKSEHLLEYLLEDELIPEVYELQKHAQESPQNDD